jgi:hypothetical protein
MSNKNPGGPCARIAALAVMASMMLLASACGSGSASNQDASSFPGTSNVAKEVAYSNCMRAHGVNVSVGSNGNFNGNGGGGGGSGSAQAVQSAMTACRHLLPGGGPNPAQVAANQARALKRALNYVACMRSHGVPNFPDPSPGFPIGFRVNGPMPGYPKANQACQSLLNGGS